MINLSNTTRVTDKDGMPTIELLKLIAELRREIEELKARVTALEP